MKNSLFISLALLSLACTRPEPAVPTFVPSLYTMQGVWQIESFTHDILISTTENGETSEERVEQSFGPGMLLTLSNRRYRFEGETTFQTVTTDATGSVESTQEQRTAVFGETGDIPTNTVTPLLMIADDERGRYSWTVNATGPDRAELTWKKDSRDERSPDHLVERRERYRMILSR